MIWIIIINYCYLFIHIVYAFDKMSSIIIWYDDDRLTIDE